MPLTRELYSVTEKRSRSSLPTWVGTTPLIWFVCHLSPVSSVIRPISVGIVPLITVDWSSRVDSAPLAASCGGIVLERKLWARCKYRSLVSWSISPGSVPEMLLSPKYLRAERKGCHA